MQPGHHAAQRGLPPDSPTRPTTSPRRMDRSTPLTAYAAVDGTAGQGQDALGQVGTLLEALVDVLQLDDGSIG